MTMSLDLVTWILSHFSHSATYHLVSGHFSAHSQDIWLCMNWELQPSWTSCLSLFWTMSEFPNSHIHLKRKLKGCPSLWCTSRLSSASASECCPSTVAAWCLVPYHHSHPVLLLGNSRLPLVPTATAYPWYQEKKIDALFLELRVPLEPTTHRSLRSLWTFEGTLWTFEIEGTGTWDHTQGSKHSRQVLSHLTIYTLSLGTGFCFSSMRFLYSPGSPGPHYVE